MEHLSPLDEEKGPVEERSLGRMERGSGMRHGGDAAENWKVVAAVGRVAGENSIAGDFDFLLNTNMEGSLRWQGSIEPGMVVGVAKPAVHWFGYRWASGSAS